MLSFDLRTMKWLSQLASWTTPTVPASWPYAVQQRHLEMESPAVATPKHNPLYLLETHTAQAGSLLFFDPRSTEDCQDV